MKRLLLFLTMALTLFGVSRAEDEVVATCLFGSSYNSQSVSSYANSWTSSNGGFTWGITNANNNNNSWGYIRIGSKNNDSTGSITTQAPLGRAITKVDLTIDEITIEYISSIKLYTSSDNSNYTEIGSFTKAKGTQTVTLDNPASDLYYKIEVSCTKASGNGPIQISKVEYYAGTETTQPSGPVDYSAPFNDQIYTIKVGETFSLTSELGELYPKVIELILPDDQNSLEETEELLTVKALAAGTVKVEVIWEDDENFTEGDASFTIVVEEATADPDPTPGGETSYQILFKTDGSDGSNALSATQILDNIDTGSEYVESVIGSNIFTGTNGLKFGSSKNLGSLTLNLSDLGKVNATKVVVNAVTYSSDDSNLSVNGSSSTKLTTSLADYSFTLTGSELSSIKIDVGGKRGYVKAITVYYNNGDTPEPEPVAYTAFDQYKDGIEFEKNQGYKLELGDSYPEIAYSFNPSGLIEIDTEGNITAIQSGKTTVTASWEADKTWEAGNAYFTVNVTEATVEPLPEGVVYSMVKSVNELYDGAEILFVNKEAKKAMSANSSNGNNRTTASIDITDDNLIIDPKDVEVITLGEEEGGKYSFSVSDGYLQAGSSSSNYLNTKATLDSNGKATISIDETTGNATITFSGSYTRNIVQYNSSSDIFACYLPTSTQKPVQIYIKQDNDSRQTPTLQFPETEYDVNIDVEDFKEPELTLNPSDLKVVYTSSNEKAATVDTVSGEVSLVAVGKTTITASFEGDDNYKAAEDSYDLMIHPVEVLSVKEALEAIANGYEGTAQVAGVITNIQENSAQYKNATYTIADSQEEGAASILVYRGKWLEGANFEGQDEIKVGDTVTVEGILVNYNGNTPEITDSKVIAYDGETIVELSFDPAEITVKQGEEATLPTLVIKQNGADVEQETADAVKAIVEYSAEGTEGLVTVAQDKRSVTIDTNIIGSATVTASIPQPNDGNYVADEASYTITVYDANHLTTEITWDSFGLDKANGSYADYILYFPAGSDEETAEIIYKVNVALPAGTMQYRSGTSKDSTIHSGIVVSKNNSYRVKSVKVEWNQASNMAGTDFSVYTNSDAYNHADDLYASEREVPTITKPATEYTDFDGIYQYLGLRSKSGALQIDKITIEWEALPMNFDVETYSWDKEWSSKGNGLGIAFMYDGDDYSTRLYDEISFEIKPLFETEGGTLNEAIDGGYSDEITSISWNDDKAELEVLFPCSGLYEIIAIPSEGYAINRSEKPAVIGTANIYPAFEGITLSYENNEEESGIYEFKGNKGDDLEYRFEVSNDNELNEKSLYPNVEIKTGENVEVWYKIHGLEDETVLESNKRRISAEELPEGFVKIENGTIDLSSIYEIEGNANKQVSFVLSKNGATTPLSANPGDDSELISKVMLTISKGENHVTGVDSVFGEAEGEVEYYTLEGIKVNADNLQNGIYVAKKGQKAVKVLIQK